MQSRNAHAQSRGSRLSRLMTLLAFLIMGVTLTAVAQPRGFKITAEGFIIDSKTQEPLFAATVKVTSADGGTGTFGITDTLGHFSFEVDRPGRFTLEFSYVGYKNLIKEVGIFPGRGANLGKFKLEEDPQMLKEVESVARSQRVKQVGDTVMYNADAYKVQDGATAEDLVAKMPGIEVTESGVKAQGETVEKVLVDGKAFFENDPRLALRTLPAEVVQSVAVFDKKSDQAEFTGFDDGNTVKAMDLKTKSYRRNGVFGKVYGGVGSNFDFDKAYWNVGFNLNNFSGNRRISLLGMSNNVNQQNFSFDDLMASGGMGGGPGGRMAFRMGGQNGVSRANALGLNYNNSFLDDKLDVQGSYFFNNLRTSLHDSIYEDYLHTSRANINFDDRLSHRYSNRMDMRISYKPNDDNEIMFRPSFNYETSDNEGYSKQEIWSSKLDSVLDYSAIRSNPDTWTTTRSTSDNSSWNAGGSLLWRHRFAKEGRTLSMEGNATVSGSDTESEYIKKGNSVRMGTNNQKSLSNTKNLRTGGNVQYTEGIGEHQQLSARYQVNYSRSENDRTVKYYDNEDFDRLLSVDTLNSSLYTSRYLTHGGEVAWRLNTETIRVNAGVNFQASQLEGEQEYGYWDQKTYGNQQNPNYTTEKNFFSVLPNFRFEWSPVQGTRIQVNYRSNASAPSIGNLQQSVNTTNELAYSTGNPNLDQSIDHSVRMSYMYSNMEKATNLMIYANFSARQDYIGTQYVNNYSTSEVELSSLAKYDTRGQYGKFLDYFSDVNRFGGLSLVKDGKISRPVNMGGYRSMGGGVTYGFPFDLLYSNVNLSVGGNYSVTPSQQLYFLGEGDKPFMVMDTKVRNFSLSPRLSINSNISQDLNFTISYGPSYQKAKDEENSRNDREYFNHNGMAKVSWTFWHGFTTEQQVNYNRFGGKSMTNVEDEWVWDMSFGKKFLKGNKAEIKLQAYDILNSRTGFSRNVGDISVRSSYNNFMPRYFLLTFTYKLASYKGASEIKERSRGFGGPGGFGGGRGRM